MLSDNIRRFSRESWEAAQKDLGEAGRAAQRELDRLTGDERSLMELALGTLPASDVASVPFDVLLGYARHALRLRERSPYCRNVPEDIFLHHVFYPRVNSEDLVDCRGFFAQMVAPEIEGLAGREAALAVNRWCARQMTYETTDNRSHATTAAWVAAARSPPSASPPSGPWAFPPGRSMCPGGATVTIITPG